MGGTEGAGRLVLIVEDYADTRLMLRLLLEGEGYAVVEAADGRQAVEEARRQCPDLILMDLHLPGVDGVEATRIIREMSEMCAVPVIAVTAMDPDECRQRAILAGCNDFILKPPDPELLLRKIRALLEVGRSARLAAGMSAALGAE